jgi:predicted alpha/beta hydrolase
MSLRDELIRVAAEAISIANMRDHKGEFVSAKDEGAAIARAKSQWADWEGEATAALDAILERLKDPSPEMCHAGQSEGAAQVFSAYPQGQGFAGFKPHGEVAIWQAMISTLEQRG